jgi:hypothetical protein
MNFRIFLLATNNSGGTGMDSSFQGRGKELGLVDNIMEYSESIKF